MDESGDCHTKWSKPDKDKYHISLIDGLLKKKNELIYKAETDPRRKQTCGYQRGNGGGIN